MAMKVRYPKIETHEDMARAGLRFPTEVTCDGKTYARTGKLGTHIATGRPSAEYARDGACVWAFADGTINEKA